jgi:hypothetical protein
LPACWVFNIVASSICGVTKAHAWEDLFEKGPIKIFYFDTKNNGVHNLSNAFSGELFFYGMYNACVCMCTFMLPTWKNKNNAAAAPGEASDSLRCLITKECRILLGPGSRVESAHAYTVYCRSTLGARAVVEHSSHTFFVKALLAHSHSNSIISCVSFGSLME